MILLSLTHTHTHTHTWIWSCSGYNWSCRSPTTPNPQMAADKHNAYYDPLVWPQWHAMEWTTAALLLQLVQWTCNAWGSYIDGSEPALTQRGLLQKPFCIGEGHGGGGQWSPSPHLLAAAQASTLSSPPPTHTEEDMWITARNILHLRSGRPVSRSWRAAGGRCGDDQPEVGG
jgi:hypothetical protein